jgi:hypothetical protein
MPRQISGNIDWPWPTMFLERKHGDLIELANNANYTFEQHAKFKIVFVSPNRSNGWCDSWVDAMGSTGGDIRLYDNTMKFDTTNGIKCISANMRSFNYPIYSIAPIGYNIVYGGMIEKSEFEFLSQSQHAFPIAYTYNVDTDIVDVLFSNDNTITFALKGPKYERYNWPSASFLNSGLNVYRYSFLTEEELCEKIQK